MELRLLGPVEVHAGDEVLAVGIPQRCVVLAALAVDAGRVVTRAQLVERVWNESPPAQVDAAVYGHMSHLRRLLRQAGELEGRPAAAAIERHSGGYLLRIDRDDVDLNRFRRLVAESRTAHRPAGLLRTALGLWHGPALAGLSGTWAARARNAWARERADAMVAWAEAELAAGDPAPVLTPLLELAAEDPLAEPVWAALVRVLVAADRTAEALDRYGEIRARLADELGVDPGPALRAAHLVALGAVPPDLPANAAAAGPVRTPASVPAQLPADVAGFAGRAAELARLDELLAGEDDTADTAVLISAVSGTAGVGKTALAVRWAHRARHRYPDGQLYVNLRGYDPEQPLAPAEVLASFLTALGVPAGDVPGDLDGRAARFRTAVAGRNLLLVLDNAATAEQVRPLLPGSASCAVLVTSRDSLAGLVAVQGAHRLELDVLPVPDATALLRRLIGERASAEPAATLTLVEQCARLPLALRIAAELAVSRPYTPLAELVAELADRRRRLDALDGADPRAAVAAVFSWSLRQLPQPSERAFRLLGRHPGPDFDAYTMAALAGTDLVTAGRTLDRLAAAHLVAALGAGRYGMHDLLRAYAASLPGEDGALTRLLDYYLATAATAVRALLPASADVPTEVPLAGTPVPAITGADAGGAWLSAERANLVAVIGYTAAHAMPEYTVMLARALAPRITLGDWPALSRIYELALAAARQLGDPADEVRALRSLSNAHFARAEYAVAEEYLREALRQSERSGVPALQASTLTDLGNVATMRQEYLAAREYYVNAEELCREAGDVVGRGRNLTNIAVIEERLGRYDTAIEYHHRALELFRQAGDQIGAARALNNLGAAEGLAGQAELAFQHLEEALRLCRQLDMHGWTGEVLESLGAVHLEHGDPNTARSYFRQALEIFHETGEPENQAWTHNSLGEAEYALAEPVAAAASHRAALELAEQIGSLDQQARAHAGLSRALVTLGEPDAAAHQRKLALDGYAALWIPAPSHLTAHGASGEVVSELTRDSGRG
jgi:DNA-binding SARP family transcriptional activator/tetratricopeptide (TPR) repeat protein